LEKINFILENEDKSIRPYDASNLPGGIIFLKHNIPTIIVPDLHARIDFFLNLMLYKDSSHYTNLQKIAEAILAIVCVGDGFHSEGRAIRRWDLAFEEYRQRYKIHKNIDEEMKESLGVMEMVMEVKSTFPGNFHFLKGNHENIKNEEGLGNHSFRKYVYEGSMVFQYIKKFYGEDFLNAYYQFEKNLPLLAVGKNFLISHSEPISFFSKESVIDYRKRPDVIEGLTWTSNDAAEDKSVKRMLDYYINEKDQSLYYFGGHRPVTGLYNLRADGRYVQIHNPNKFIIALIKDNKAISLDKDIFEIENNIDKIINLGKKQ